MKEILQKEEYGRFPVVDCRLSAGKPVVDYENYALGAVKQSHVDLTLRVGTRSHTFRVERLWHQDGKKRPLIIVANFFPMDGRYFPTEELSESECNFLLFVNKDVTTDDDDFTNGIAPLLLPKGQVKDDDPGKIMMWAFAATKVLDYALEHLSANIDLTRIAIAGHSRLGKTALVTGMMDERFTHVYSNAAGCSGEALCRGNTGFGFPRSIFSSGPRGGELIEDIVRRFPYWFCKNFHKYRKTNIPTDFDQHYLVAALAPRKLLTVSCTKDDWADPKGTQLSLIAASKAWEEKGVPGFLGGSDHYLLPEEFVNDGNIAYYLQDSPHLFSRHGWQRFLEFIAK